jgi:hypothetical protein
MSFSVPGTGTDVSSGEYSPSAGGPFSRSMAVMTESFRSPACVSPLSSSSGSFGGSRPRSLMRRQQSRQIPISGTCKTKTHEMLPYTRPAAFPSPLREQLTDQEGRMSYMPSIHTRREG